MAASCGGLKEGRTVRLVRRSVNRDLLRALPAHIARGHRVQRKSAPAVRYAEGMDDPVHDAIENATKAWRLLHQDESMLVVEKPAGLLAVPGRGEAGLHNLSALVQAQFADALVVHRLDMATSGLMLFARGAAAQSALNRAFAHRRIAKRYEAVVEGDVAGEFGSIHARLSADWPQRPRQKVDPEQGKAALTHWRVLKRAVGPGQAHTRLSLEPFTGRSHQLRVHLMSIGHPIVGDALYGQPPGPEGRLLLHACSLAFVHPGSGQACQFESAPPF